MPNGVSTDQWFLEVNGKKFGPYTMAQINALVRHHEIVGQDKVTAPHLSGKWITVQEFVNQSEPTAAIATPSATKSAVVPPRPDERTLTSITAPSHAHAHEPRKNQSDAVLNLFEILQAARERKTQNQTPTTVGHSVIEMPRPVKSSTGSGLFWMAVPALVVVAVAAWKMTSSHSPAPAPVAETETSAKAVAPQASAPKSAPVTASAPVSKPVQAATRTVATTTPAAKPKMTPSASGFSVGRQAIHSTPSAPSVSEHDRDRERDRELEREREREAERELEREKEREAEYARNSSGAPAADTPRSERDRERERERERESERDRRDPRDRATSYDALPVTGGTPADPASFRDDPETSRSNGGAQFQ